VDFEGFTKGSTELPTVRSTIPCDSFGSGSMGFNIIGNKVSKYLIQQHCTVQGWKNSAGRQAGKKPDRLTMYKNADIFPCITHSDQTYKYIIPYTTSSSSPSPIHLLYLSRNRRLLSPSATHNFNTAPFWGPAENLISGLGPIDMTGHTSSEF
jgi:hypothetical protein